MKNWRSVEVPGRFVIVYRGHLVGVVVHVLKSVGIADVNRRARMRAGR